MLRTLTRTGKKKVDGGLLRRLKQRWRDRTTHVLFDSLEQVDRLLVTEKQNVNVGEPLAWVAW
jgi:hypothetical protein